MRLFQIPFEFQWYFRRSLKHILYRKIRVWMYVYAIHESFIFELYGFCSVLCCVVCEFNCNSNCIFTTNIVFAATEAITKQEVCLFWNWKVVHKISCSTKKFPLKSFHSLLSLNCFVHCCWIVRNELMWMLLKHSILKF